MVGGSKNQDYPVMKITLLFTCWSICSRDTQRPERGRVVLLFFDSKNCMKKISSTLMQKKVMMLRIYFGVVTLFVSVSVIFQGNSLVTLISDGFITWNLLCRDLGFSLQNSSNDNKNLSRKLSLVFVWQIYSNLGKYFRVKTLFALCWF